MLKLKIRPRGMALIYVLVAMVALIAMASLAVDFGKLQIAKSELTTAVDSAGLAAASGLRISPYEARLRAKTFAAKNKVDGKSLTLLDSDIQMGKWDSSSRAFVVLTGANEANANAVRITGQLSAARNNAVGLAMLPILRSGNDFQMSSTSISAVGAAADVVMVQDITSSFQEELADAKVGDQAVLDALYNAGGQTGFGLVAFTGWGKTLSDLKRISTNYAALTTSITNIQHCGSTGMPVCSGTDIAAGIDMGVTVFDAYTGGSSSKAMIIVSDGDSTQNSSGSHPSLSDAQLLTLAQQRANAAWAKKIHVYVVFFDRDNDATAASNLATLVRGNGIFIRESDPKQLPAALKTVTRALPAMLVQ